MKKLTALATLAALLLPALVMAQSAFVGTWKADLSNVQMPQKPDRYLLDKGVFECLTCVPPVKVPADGQDHAVSGHPYFDTVAVKIIDDHTIQETDKKAGKTVTTSTTRVAADGKTATFEFSDNSASNGAPIVGSGVATRVAAAPAGAHATSGSWRTTKLNNISDNGLLVTYALDGSTLKMSNQLGQSYAAPLNGKDVPYTGDPGLTSVSVKRISANTVEESDKRNGKVVWVGRMTVAADGRNLKVAWKDNLRGTSGSYAAVKQ
ncbi:MAG TPA: hypothetical protein VGH84_00810 [Steroidobacteraceae bacterium]|jgi:hypothetical protein